ncbi:MAG: GNAT family N-acetyltransferase [Clostridiales bacterium]|nr:GNAT family N-acetyltransferase [Clostridiales bacterium]
MDPKAFPVVPLPASVWKGTVVPIRYTTETYYDVVSERTADGWHIRLEKKRFEEPVTHTPEEYDFPDKLYEDYRPDAEAWGIVSETGELLGCIETFPEDWSNRLIVSEMWVAEPYRRRGLGHRLMAAAKERAEREGRRAIMLETQSCNTGAIAFYESEGFALIGFDLCCYSNRDRERREVRFDFGYFPDKVPKNG